MNLIIFITFTGVIFFKILGNCSIQRYWIIKSYFFEIFRKRLTEAIITQGFIFNLCNWQGIGLSLHNKAVLKLYNPLEYFLNKS